MAILYEKVIPYPLYGSQPLHSVGIPSASRPAKHLRNDGQTDLISRQRKVSSPWILSRDSTLRPNIMWKSTFVRCAKPARMEQVNIYTHESTSSFILATTFVLSHLALIPSHHHPHECKETSGTTTKLSSGGNGSRRWMPARDGAVNPFCWLLCYHVASRIVANFAI